MATYLCFFRGWWIGEAWWEISTEKCVSMVQTQWWLYVDICCKGNSSPWFSLFVIYQANNQTSRYEVWWSQGWCWHWLAGRPGLDYAGLIFWTSKPWILASEGALNPSGVLITFFLILNDFDFRKELVLRIAHVIHFPGVFASIFHPGKRSLEWSCDPDDPERFAPCRGTSCCRDLWLGDDQRDPDIPRLSNPMARVEYF